MALEVRQPGEIATKRAHRVKQPLKPSNTVNGQGAALDEVIPGRAKLLTVSSSKGGSTKTTTVRNLAVAAAHHGLRVCTVNLDAQPTLTTWVCNRRGVPGAPEIAHQTMSAKGCIDKIRALVTEGGFHLILVDTPPGVESYPVELRMLIRESDFVVLTTQQANADLDSVTEWSKTIRREEVQFTFLLGRTSRQQRNFDAAKARLNDEGDLCPFDVRAAASVDDSDKLGIGNMEIRGDRCGEDFRGVWGYVAKKLGLAKKEV
jgi:chromosome partitioning protein